MRASGSPSDLPMNIQCWFPLRLAGLISLQAKGLTRVFFSTTVQKHQFFGAQPSLWSNFPVQYTTTGNKQTKKLTIQTFVCKVISLLFNTLSRLVIERSRCLLISWWPSPSTMILKPKEKENKICHHFHFSHLFAMKWWDQMPWSSYSECWVLSQIFHSPLSPSSRGSLVSLHFLP